VSSTSVLTVDIRPCIRLNMIIVLAHLGAIAVVLDALYWVWAIPISFLVILNFFSQFKRAQQSYRLTLFQDLSGVLRKGENDAISGTLSSQSYLSSYLILLNFKPAFSRLQTIPVFPGSLRSEEFQGLLSFINTFKSATNCKSCL